MKKPKLSRKAILLINGFLLLVPLTYFFYDDALELFGHVLIVDMQPEPSDAIVVLAGGVERARAAADLYRQGMGQYVVMTTEPLPEGVDEIRGLGIEIVEPWENYFRVLKGFGVPEDRIIRIKDYVDSTIDEGNRVRELALEKGWKKLLIVTSTYHTRRTLITMRYLLGPDIGVRVTASRYDGFDASNWWKRRGYLRIFIIEFEKLLLYAPYYWTKSIF